MKNFIPKVYEHDICLRAWTKYGWISGSYWIKWTSEIKWGGTRKTPEKYIWLEKKGEANKEFLFKRHFLYFASNVKHNKNIKIK